MNNDPIFEKLITGGRFSYSLLRSERNAVNEFRKWWWNKADLTCLSRPKSLIDDDPILVNTVSKKTINTATDDFMFSDPLRNLLMKNILPTGDAIDRTQYRQALVDFLTQRGLKSSTPTVVFTGGGYGAGKTSTLQWLAKNNRAPAGLTVSSLQGVDYCKQLLPEFSQVQRVADGRASEICQDESRLISDMLFLQLVEEKRSFGWDSSMSNMAATLKKIEFAESKGYKIILLAVVIDVQVAITRAMERARQTHRFAPPDYLENSHKSFTFNIKTYIEKSEEVMIIENSRSKIAGGPRLIAQKRPEEINLKVFDQALYESYMSPIARNSSDQ